MNVVTGTFLDEIVASTRAAVAALPDPTIDVGALQHVRSLRASVEAVAAGGGLGVIAEHKRRSPSRGMLAPANDQIANRAAAYEAAGAVGMSVLTEAQHF